MWFVVTDEKLGRACLGILWIGRSSYATFVERLLRQRRATYYFNLPLVFAQICTAVTDIAVAVFIARIVAVRACCAII